MTIDFSDPDFPILSLVVSKEILRAVQADKGDGVLQISRQTIVAAIEASGKNGIEDVYKKYQALLYVPGFKN
jgi:hypothetical protein